MQKAQLFGWSKRATDLLDYYRRFPVRFKVIPAYIVVAP